MGHWMGNCKSVRVEGLPVEERAIGILVCRTRIMRFLALWQQFQFANSRPAAVQPVAKNWMADVSQVDANLVRSSRLWPQAHDCIADEPLDDFVLRHCFT